MLGNCVKITTPLAFEKQINISNVFIKSKALHFLNSDRLIRRKKLEKKLLSILHLKFFKDL